MQSSKNNSKLVVGVVLAVAVGLALLIWVLVGRSANAPSESLETESSSNGTSISSENGNNADQSTDYKTIVFKDNGFSPAELTVKKGTTVVVKNESSDSMQFSSDDHPTHRLNQELNLSVLSPGKSASFVVSKVGEWGFHDHLDSSQTGTITVTE